MQRATGGPAVVQFDGGDFNDPMTLLRIEPGGFRVEDKQAHAVGTDALL